LPPVPDKARPTNGPLHTTQCPRTGPHRPQPLRRWLWPAGRPEPGFPASTPCRIACRIGSPAPTWPSHRASSGVARLDRVLDSSPIPVFSSFLSQPATGLRPSTGITRLLRYHEPLRLPRRPETDHFRSPQLTVATRH